MSCEAVDGLAGCAGAGPQFQGVVGAGLNARASSGAAGDLKADARRRRRDPQSQ